MICSQTIEEEENSTSNTSTGKENEAAKVQQTEELMAMQTLEVENLDTARFQYNGVLNMEVVIDISKDNFSCLLKEEVDWPDPADVTGAQSLHVMPYMTTFSVDIYLEYTIFEGVTCDIVDDDLRILVINNVGFDNFAGSEQFKASITDDLTKAALSHCNPEADAQYCTPKDFLSGYEECVCQEGVTDKKCLDSCDRCLKTCDNVNCFEPSTLEEWKACLSGSRFLTEVTETLDPNPCYLCKDVCETSGCAFSVEHDTNDDGENTGARVANLLFATGRPNIVAPYTKPMIFKVIGADLMRKAAIFIEGLYSKGPGNSFALPAHEPIMIYEIHRVRFFCRRHASLPYFMLSPVNVFAILSQEAYRLQSMKTLRLPLNSQRKPMRHI